MKPCTIKQPDPDITLKKSTQFSQGSYFNFIDLKTIISISYSILLQVKL